jgi:hypothetical protein
MTQRQKRGATPKSIILITLFILACLGLGVEKAWDQTVTPGENMIDYGGPVILVTETDGAVTLCAKDGHKTTIDNFFEKVKGYLPEDSNLNEIVAYLIDLNQNGQYEIVVDAKDSMDGLEGRGQSMLMILDEKGSLLTEKVIEVCSMNKAIGFESLGKGKPTYMAILIDSFLSAGSAEWRYYVWLHGTIKEILLTDDGGDGTGSGLLGDFIKKTWDQKKEAFLTREGIPIDNSQHQYHWVTKKEMALDKLEKSKLFVQWGKEAYLKHDFDLSISYYRWAIVANENNDEAWGLTGYVNLLKHKTSDWYLQPLKKSIQINPNYLKGHYNLALAYWASSDKTPANQNLAFNEIATVLKLDPKYNQIIHNDPQFKKIFNSEAYKAWESQQTK